MIDLFPVVGPVLRCLEPECAHSLTIRALSLGVVPPWPAPPPEPGLTVRLWGLEFPNPVGIAAGFDKNAEAIAPMLALGAGFVEVGTVTPRPQPGNPRPRCFRLPDQHGMINRYGFNNQGLRAVARRLAIYRKRRHPWPGLVGANLGRNKDSLEAIADYQAGVRALAPLADYLVINVSSPNTPGLRTLQDRAPLTALLTAVRETRASLAMAAPPPLLLKIAPDLGEDDLAAVAEVSLAVGIDGVIVSNTTLSRPALEGVPVAAQAGGLSGRPLYPLATRCLSEFYRLTGGRLPLIGVGGISSAEEAYGKIRAGATLVQLYTALIYQGPRLIHDIRQGLAGFLRRDGFATLAEAVGSAHRLGAP